MKLRSVPAVAAAVLIAAGVSAAPAQADTPSRAGCPGGAVCMYEGNGYANNTPEHIWTSYGFHPLHNEYGTRIVLNNQYQTSAGRAGAYMCRSWDPSSCNNVIEMGFFTYVYIDPINYVRLTPSGG